MYFLFRALLIANALLAALAGCSQRKTFPDEYPSQLVDGDKRVLGFVVDDCGMADCSRGVQFAAAEGQHLVRLEGLPFCTSAAWTARVTNRAVAQMQWSHEAPATDPCDAQSRARPIALTELAVGASRLEILDRDGTIVDALSFSVAPAAALSVTSYHGGPGADLKLTPVAGRPDHRRAEQAFVRVLDAAGRELAINAPSIRWTVANPEVANFGDARAEQLGDLAMLYAAANAGATSVTIEAAGLSRAVPATIVQ